MLPIAIRLEIERSYSRTSFIIKFQNKRLTISDVTFVTKFFIHRLSQSVPAPGPLIKCNLMKFKLELVERLGRSVPSTGCDEMRQFFIV